MLGDLFDELESYLASNYEIIPKYKIGEPERKHVMLPIVTEGENVVTINLDSTPVFGLEILTPESHVEYLYDSSIGIPSALTYGECSDRNEKPFYHKEWGAHIESVRPLFAVHQEP